MTAARLPSPEIAVKTGHSQLGVAGLFCHPAVCYNPAMPPTLAEVEALADQLSEADRGKLREHVSLSLKFPVTPEEAEQAIQNFQRLLGSSASPTGTATEQFLRER